MTYVVKAGSPMCVDCGKRMGWTRLIRRMHAGKSLVCWVCAWKQRNRGN
jgi:hypothetical protein